MMTSQCFVCKWYTIDLKCLAFPDGIPVEILKGKYNHVKPFKGDNGITFEKKTQGNTG